VRVNGFIGEVSVPAFTSEHVFLAPKLGSHPWWKTKAMRLPVSQPC